MWSRSFAGSGTVRFDVPAGLGHGGGHPGRSITGVVGIGLEQLRGLIDADAIDI